MDYISKPDKLDPWALKVSKPNKLADYHPNPDPLQHTQCAWCLAALRLTACRSPSVTGSSVLGLKFQGGVILAADTLGARHVNAAGTFTPPQGRTAALRSCDT